MSIVSLTRSDGSMPDLALNLEVFKSFGSKELVICSQVCKMWNDQIKSSDFILESVYRKTGEKACEQIFFLPNSDVRSIIDMHVVKSVDTLILNLKKMLSQNNTIIKIDFIFPFNDPACILREELCVSKNDKLEKPYNTLTTFYIFMKRYPKKTIATLTFNKKDITISAQQTTFINVENRTSAINAFTKFQEINRLEKHGGSLVNFLKSTIEIFPIDYRFFSCFTKQGTQYTFTYFCDNDDIWQTKLRKTDETDPMIFIYKIGLFNQ